MADFTPNSVVRVLANVPLDNTYSDVIKFQSAAAQATYFQGKTIATFTALTYQRVNSSVQGGRPANTIRVPAEADTLYNANYIMFQNTNFGNKWFYGFINKVNYVSPNCSEINYEIDHYQTWQFNMTVLPSFVEREHTLADGLFLNREPEPVGTFPLYRNGTSVNYDYSGQAYIVVCTVTDTEGEVVQGQMAGRVYSGLKFNVFTDAGSANSFIESYAKAKPWVPNPDIPEQKGGKLDAVVCVFMSPYNVNTPPSTYVLQCPRPGTLNGYAPRNLKLFNSPWTALTLTSGSGGRVDFDWEGFSVGSTPGDASFDLYFTTGFNPSITCAPRNYISIDSQLNDMSRALTISDFPVCGWAGNVFANWMAQNQNAQFIGFLGNVVGVGSSAVGSYNAGGGEAAVVQAGVGAFIDLAQKMNERAVRANDPGRAKGMPAGGTMIFEHQKITFTATPLSISAQAAAGIDAFFDMFGYATNRVKVPNMTGRASWNYVKTRNVIITGNMPVESMAVIKNMFNAGVRFWHGDFVGQYNLPNPIVEGAEDDTPVV